MWGCLMSAGDALKDTIADGFAEADELVEDYREAFSARVLELLGNIEQRSPGIWKEAQANILATVLDFSQVPVRQRDEIWGIEFGRIIAAAQEQAFTEIITRPMLQVSSKWAMKKLDTAKAVPVSQMKQVAVEGVSKERFDAAKERRKAARVT